MFQGRNTVNQLNSITVLAAEQASWGDPETLIGAGFVLVIIVALAIWASR
jgi:hypothetical protein